MKNQFAKYLNGTCTPEEFAKVIESFGNPADESVLSKDLLQLWDEASASPIEARENDRLLDKIHHRIDLEELLVADEKLRHLKNLLKIAAIVVLGLITTAIIITTKPERKVLHSVVQTVTIPYGARTSFKLPDGSLIWLYSGSSISYPSEFGESRDIQLTGQAYIEVVKDGKPFIVNTVYGDIRVLGTSLNAKAYPNENFETTLVKGSVAVTNRKNQVVTLEPGQQSVITSSDILTVKRVNTDKVTSWKEGKLIFEKEPFQNVVRELERWYNIKIELQGEKLKKLGYTGTIEMETFSEVLELVKTTTHINYRFDKHNRVLKISGR